LATWASELEQTRAHIDHVLETYGKHMQEHDEGQG
jgi:hypothetical protein